MEKVDWDDVDGVGRLGCGSGIVLLAPNTTCSFFLALTEA